jgi:hypothetical protein
VRHRVLKAKMLSKVVRLTNGAFARNSNLMRSLAAPLRFYSAEQPPPPKTEPAAAAQPPKPASSVPPKTETLNKTKPEVGKGTGPVTWKSLSIAAAFGAGLLVRRSF